MMEELGTWLGTRLLPIARGFFNFLLMFRAHRGVLLQVCSPPFTTAAFPVCILFVCLCSILQLFFCSCSVPVALAATFCVMRSTGYRFMGHFGVFRPFVICNSSFGQQSVSQSCRLADPHSPTAPLYTRQKRGQVRPQKEAPNFESGPRMRLRQWTLFLPVELRNKVLDDATGHLVNEALTIENSLDDQQQ